MGIYSVKSCKSISEENPLNIFWQIFSLLLVDKPFHCTGENSSSLWNGLAYKNIYEIEYRFGNHKISYNHLKLTQLYDNWPFSKFFSKQTNPNQSNRRPMVQWYFPPPLVFPGWIIGLTLPRKLGCPGPNVIKLFVHNLRIFVIS